MWFELAVALTFEVKADISSFPNSRELSGQELVSYCYSLAHSKEVITILCSSEAM